MQTDQYTLFNYIHRQFKHYLKSILLARPCPLKKTALAYFITKGTEDAFNFWHGFFTRIMLCSYIFLSIYATRSYFKKCLYFSRFSSIDILYALESTQKIKCGIGYPFHSHQTENTQKGLIWQNRNSNSSITIKLCPQKAVHLKMNRSRLFKITTKKIDWNSLFRE